VEKDSVLRAESVLQVISVKNRLELSQEFQGIFDAGDHLEVFVDVFLEIGLNC